MVGNKEVVLGRWIVFGRYKTFSGSSKDFFVLFGDFFGSSGLFATELTSIKAHHRIFKASSSANLSGPAAIFLGQR